MTTQTEAPKARREPKPLNGVDTPALFATINAVAGQRELADFRFRATNRWIKGTQSRTGPRACQLGLCGSEASLGPGQVDLSCCVKSTKFGRRNSQLLLPIPDLQLLPIEVLGDLKTLFAALPSDRYRIYRIVKEEGKEEVLEKRLVMDIVVRDGEPIELEGRLPQVDSDPVPWKQTRSAQGTAAITSWAS